MQSYCEKFGLNDEGRTTLLKMIGLSEKDLPLGQILQQDVIIPNVETIFTRFYDILFSVPEAQKIMSMGYSIDNLKKTQKQYLLSFGLKFLNFQYFENRLKIGHTHVRVGVKPALYLSYRDRQ